MSAKAKGDFAADFPTSRLLAFRELGIQLLPAQEQQLALLGYGRPPDYVAIARNHATEAMRTEEGVKATQEGYYTEMFNWLYCQALSQLREDRKAELELPSPVPEEWVAIGHFRKRKLPSQPKPEEPKERNKLDEEVDRILAQKLS